MANDPKFPRLVNLRGEPWQAAGEAEPTVADVAPALERERSARTLTPEDLAQVQDALVLAGWQRGRSALVALLRALEWRRNGGAFFGAAEVHEALRVLARQGQARAVQGDGWMAEPGAARVRLPALLALPELREAWKAWLWAANGCNGPVGELPRPYSLRSRDEAVSVFRWLLVSGMAREPFAHLAPLLTQGLSLASALHTALDDLAQWGLLDRADRPLLWQLLGELGSGGGGLLAPELLRWAEAQAEELPGEGATLLRWLLGERRLHAGDAAGAQRLLQTDPQAHAFATLFQALAPAQAGHFAEATAAFAPAWKDLCALLGRRSGFAPLSLLQWALLAQMAQPEPAAWAAARKFAVSQSGARNPDPLRSWGLWAHALAVRLGDARALPEAFEHRKPVAPSAVGAWDVSPVHALQPSADRRADRFVLAAWLGFKPRGWDGAALQSLSDELHAQGLPWKADLLLQACLALGLPAPARPPDAPPPWPAVFFKPRQDAWRDALAAITALAGTGKGAMASSAQPLATLTWRLALDAEGRVVDLHALETAATSRGKPKPLSLLQIKRRTRLDPRDAAVARTLRSAPYRANQLSFDLTAAAQALVGHPALWLDGPADGLGVGSSTHQGPVELSEGLPVLEVRRERAAADSGGAGQSSPDAVASSAEHYVFKLLDPVLASDWPDLRFHVEDDGNDEAEAERRNNLRVVRDSAERARLLRITPAQRRVAELMSQRWAVPVQATAELDAALRVLSGHFLLHSDASAGEPVPADARLLARLQPRGDGLALQLGVRPFGSFGPVLPPGQGRQRLITLHQGVSLATERDLAAERRHAEAVLQPLPFLGAGADDLPPEATWQIDEPEQVLTVVQELGQLADQGTALRALEWPQGKPIRVLAPESKAFSTQLKSRAGWFELEGELKLDEGRVLSLQQLLGLLREAQGSRYMALGSGQYLRLTEQLRQRLVDLQALAEASAKQLKLGHTATAWLAEAAPELGLQGDAGWQRRAAELEQAARLQPAVPAGLQAELRAYQVEGYAWMCRLGAAGFGGILADDMGLGKTVQTLALLLARAALGPALVVAPTSVCDNWLAEASRFAPGLRCSVYGRGDVERGLQIDGAQAGDVLVVSYALLLRDAEAFAARPWWASLVLDEAQALKNAATQRVQAVAALQAGFRLALSGTPVENRLADLWSLMNLLNPGLLGTAARFNERFAGPIERQRNEGARGRLRRLVSPFLLRRTKAQVLTDLPPRTEIVQRIEPGAEERAFLEALRREALERIARLDPQDPQQNRFNVLAELTRLRRAACDPRLVVPELGRIGAKVQAFERLAIELVEGRHQALVFSQFTDFLKLLAQRLDAAGLRYQYLDGSTPAAVRGDRVAAFQRGEAEIFLISLKAGGFGLNLTAADYVIIADPWWNPAAEDQAMGRAHRMGQQRPVTVYRLVTAGSVEERIVALHQDKRDLAESLLAGQESGTPLAAAELVDLLRAAG